MSQTPLPSVASPIQAYLEVAPTVCRAHHRPGRQLHSRVGQGRPGVVGIVIATVDGQVYEVGTTRERFTIQSISKPMVYGVALEDRGQDRVHQAIGIEPSGEAFNSMT